MHKVFDMVLNQISFSCNNGSKQDHVENSNMKIKPSTDHFFDPGTSTQTGYTDHFFDPVL